MEIDKDNLGTATLYVTKNGVNYSISEKTMTFTPEIIDDMEIRRNNVNAEILLGKLSLVRNIPDRWIEFWCDDVRIYDIALDATQVTELMSAFAEEETEPVTEAPATEAPKTEAPVTEAPVTVAPKTDAPVTNAPATDVTTTDVPKTDEPITEAPKVDVPNTEKEGSPILIIAVAAVCVAAIAAAAIVIAKKKK